MGLRRSFVFVITGSPNRSVCVCVLSDYPVRGSSSQPPIPLSQSKTAQNWRPRRYQCKSHNNNNNSKTNHSHQPQTAVECLEKGHAMRQSRWQRDEPMNLFRLKFRRRMTNNRQMDTTTIMVPALPTPLPETVRHRNVSAASASMTMGWKRGAAITAGHRIRTASGMGTSTLILHHLRQLRRRNR